MLLAVLASLVALVAVQAFSKDFVLELTIITDKQEEYVQIVELGDREFRNLRNDTNRVIQEYLLVTRKKYADESGYRREIYGDENFKMVVIKSFTFVVKDKSSGRILLRK